MTHTIGARIAGLLATSGLVIAAVAAPTAALATIQPDGHASATRHVIVSDGNAPSDAPPTDAAPSDATPTDAVPTDGSPTDEGEVVYDPIFITPTPDATPIGEVLAATGRPDVTPPPTDVLGGSRASGGSGIQAVLLALAGLSSMVLLLGRVPAARRR